MRRRIFHITNSYHIIHSVISHITNRARKVNKMTKWYSLLMNTLYTLKSVSLVTRRMYKSSSWDNEWRCRLLFSSRKKGNHFTAFQYIRFLSNLEVSFVVTKGNFIVFILNGRISDVAVKFTNDRHDIWYRLSIKGGDSIETGLCFLWTFVESAIDIS